MIFVFSFSHLSQQGDFPRCLNLDGKLACHVQKVYSCISGDVGFREMLMAYKGKHHQSPEDSLEDFVSWSVVMSVE